LLRKNDATLGCRRSAVGHCVVGVRLLLLVVIVALWNRAGHYIFALWFLSFFFLFFSRLIPAAADWMSTIFLHMVGPIVRI